MTGRLCDRDFLHSLEARNHRQIFRGLFKYLPLNLVISFFGTLFNQADCDEDFFIHVIFSPLGLSSGLLLICFVEMSSMSMSGAVHLE